MIIQWNFESPLFLDETIVSLSEKVNENRTDFDNVPDEKWNRVAQIWLDSNPLYKELGMDINTVIKFQKEAALKLIKDYSVGWSRKYNVE